MGAQAGVEFERFQACVERPDRIGDQPRRQVGEGLEGAIRVFAIVAINGERLPLPVLVQIGFAAWLLALDGHVFTATMRTAHHPVVDQVPLTEQPVLDLKQPRPLLFKAWLRFRVVPNADARELAQSDYLDRLCARSGWPQLHLGLQLIH